jgi:hypothetical protein
MTLAWARVPVLVFPQCSLGVGEAGGWTPPASSESTLADTAVVRTPPALRKPRQRISLISAVPAAA